MCPTLQTTTGGPDPGVVHSPDGQRNPLVAWLPDLRQRAVAAGNGPRESGRQGPRRGGRTHRSRSVAARRSEWRGWVLARFRTDSDRLSCARTTPSATGATPATRDGPTICSSKGPVINTARMAKSTPSTGTAVLGHPAWRIGMRHIGSDLPVITSRRWSKARIHARCLAGSPTPRLCILSRRIRLSDTPSDSRRRRTCSPRR
jgi:hypothetical protein